MDAPPIANIVGERVALGPLRRELVPLIARWLNDFGTQRTLGGDPTPRTLEASEALYDDLIARENYVQFTISECASGRPIGITELQGIDLRHGTAEFIIFIGEPEYRGLGLGTEATRLILGYAFGALGLHNVLLRVYEYNLAGLRAYERAGFRVVGRQRRCHWLNGRHWDAILMDCLASDFAAGDGGGGGR